MHGLLPWILFYIGAQKRSRVTKLGAQTHHRVVLRFAPPSASKQSEIMCTRDKCVVSIILVRPSPAALGGFMYYVRIDVSKKIHFRLTDD